MDVLKKRNQKSYLIKSKDTLLKYLFVKVAVTRKKSNCVKSDIKVSMYIYGTQVLKLKGK